jgi:hypothetical protein
MTGGNFQFAMVARGTTPLAEFGVASTNSRGIVLKMLESLDPKKMRGIVEQPHHLILSLTDPDRMTYVCVVDRQISIGAGYSFLDKVKAKWRARYGNSGSSFAANSKNAEFGDTEIATLMRNYNSESFQKINQVIGNLEAGQTQMMQNLTMALTRGKGLTDMEEKAELMRRSAETFRTEAKALRCQQCLSKWRWYLLAIVILMVVIVIILLVACGGKFQKCGGDPPSPTATPQAGET